jgi:hypothetical protein
MSQAATKDYYSSLDLKRALADRDAGKNLSEAGYATSSGSGENQSWDYVPDSGINAFRWTNPDTGQTYKIAGDNKSGYNVEGMFDIGEKGLRGSSTYDPSGNYTGGTTWNRSGVGRDALAAGLIMFGGPLAGAALAGGMAAGAGGTVAAEGAGAGLTTAEAAGVGSSVIPESATGLAGASSADMASMGLANPSWYSTLSPWEQGALQGAGRGAVTSAIQGRNPITGAVVGGLSGGVGGAVGDAAGGGLVGKLAGGAAGMGTGMLAGSVMGGGGGPPSGPSGMGGMGGDTGGDISSNMGKIMGLGGMSGGTSMIPNTYARADLAEQQRQAMDSGYKAGPHQDALPMGTYEALQKSKMATDALRTPVAMSNKWWSG